MSNERPFRSSFRSYLPAYGLQMKFENGWGISIQNGAALYGDGKINPESGEMEADTVEVAIFKPNGEFYRMTRHDDVQGYLTPDDVAVWIAFAAGEEHPERIWNEDD